MDKLPEESAEDIEDTLIAAATTPREPVGPPIPLAPPLEDLEPVIGHELLDEIVIYNRALSAGEIAQLVPEPSSLLLTALGLLGIVLWRRRRTAAVA